MDDGLRELRFLQRLALAAASTLEPDRLLRLVISETTEATATDVCSIYLLDRAGEELVLTATNGLSQAGVGRVRLRMGEGLTGWAAAERQAVAVLDVRAEPRFRWLPGVDQARFVSMCSVPIVSGDRLVGVINVQTDRPREFGSDVGFLEAIAATVAGALERSELQARLEERVADLRRSEEVHRRFSELALTGAGLDAIVSAISRHADASVAVYDEDGERLSVDGEGMPARLEGFADPERRDDGLSVRPVRAGRDLLGWLAATPARGPGPAPARSRALEHGVTVLALDLLRERAAAEAERRLRGDLVEELLTARLAPADANRLARRARRLGYRLRGPAWVIALEPDDAEAAAALSSPTPRRRTLRLLSDLLATRGPGGLAVDRGQGMVLLVTGEPPMDRVESLAAAAIDATRAAVGGASSFSAGIGSEAGGPSELRRLSEEARGALRIARRLGRRGSVSAYSRLGVERLLLEIERPERLAGYVAEWLGPLLRHEEGGRAAAPLIDTLAALAAESWSPRAAARRLTCHVNTLLYRIGRIEELTGLPLDDPDVRLNMTMALRARTLMAGLDSATEINGAEARSERPYLGRRREPNLPPVTTTERER